MRGRIDAREYGTGEELDVGDWARGEGEIDDFLSII
jgi:hypothetical protein